MAQAVWEGMVIAESDDCVIVEGNHYFPPEAVNMSFLQQAEGTTVCGWKGMARYYDVVVGGKRNPGAAWYYADPKPAAAEIRGRIAFWRGVRVR